MLDNITDSLDSITDRLDNVIVRLVAYYIATSLFFASILLLLPDILISITGGEMSSILTILSSPQSGAEVGRLLEKSSVSGADLRLKPEDVERLLEKSGVFYLPTFVPISMALLFSFFYALPVTWVYRWTRPRKKYNQDLVHTLLVVPIAISLVVFLVKDSVALAFSLAGIVAAVQFRTTLRDPLDATYMFIVIGIGLSAGMGIGQVAILASVAFNAVVLGIWRTNYGAKPAVLSGFRLVRPAKSLPGVSGTQAGKIPKPYNAKLRVHTAQVEAAQQAAVALLATYAKQWRQVRIVQQEDGTVIVEFDVRLKKTADPAAFTRELEKSTEGHTVKVELEL